MKWRNVASLRDPTLFVLEANGQGEGVFLKALKGGSASVKRMRAKV